MLLHRVRRTIDHFHLLDQSDRLVVGVSAGADSMVLLNVLNTYRQTFNLTLIVAYVNHGLRPKESEEEAKFVQKECDRLALTFECGTFNVKEFQRVGGFSVQEAARRLRFYFFDQLLQKYQAQKIALGHHADDQVETFLLRLMRGAGLQGLKGILPVREGRVIRPLLEVWRHEIETFAYQHSIPFLTDASNLKKDYLRNRLRLHLIPLLEKEYQPNVKQVLLRTSAILREENDYLEREAEKVYRNMVGVEGEALTFHYTAYQSLHPAIQWRVIQKALRDLYGKEREDVEVPKIFKKLQQSSPSYRQELPFGICMEKRYNKVQLVRKKVEDIPPFEVELNSPGRTFVEEIGREVVIEEMSVREQDCIPKTSPDTALLDYQVLQFPLRIRNFRPGDRFQPLGVKGTQKLKEFFIDHKIPRFERQRVPLLISGERIVWVIGYRIDECARIGSKTKKILKVKVV